MATDVAPRKVVGYLPKDRPPFIKNVLFSAQVVIVAFAATTLVPLLVGVPVSTALFSSGVATVACSILSLLLFGTFIPLFYGSSFSFIAVMVAITKVAYGAPASPDALAMLEAGVVTVGVIEIVVGIWIRRAGLKALDNVLPPVIIGSTVMVIGLALAFAAVNMLFGGCCNAQGNTQWVVAGVFTLVVTALAKIYLRGFPGQISLLIGAVSGYVLWALMGMVNWATIGAAPVFQAPHIVLPNFLLPGSLGAIVAIAVMAVAVIPEMVGHLSQLGLYVDEEAEEQHREAVGLDKLQGENMQLAGIGDIICGMLTGVPGTSYAEGIAAAVFSKAYSGYVYIGAGIIVILMGLSGTLAAIFNTFPTAVIGGLAVPMFGAIGLQGVAYLQRHQVNFFDSKNLLLGGMVLIFGIAGIGYPNGLLPVSIPVLFPTGLPAIATGIVLALVLNQIIQRFPPAPEEA